MNILRYLKNIYCGKLSIFNHISLFSLIGISVIMLNNATSKWGNYLFGFSFFSVPPKNNTEMIAYSFAGTFISLYLAGYGLRFAGNAMNNNAVLPEFDWKPFTAYVRFLPLLAVWNFYAFVMLMFGLLCVFSENTAVLSYVYVSLLICLVPFVQMVFVSFTKDFKYKKELFTPVTIIRYTDKTLTDVVILSLQAGLFLLVPAGIVRFGLKYAAAIPGESLKLSVYLIILCFSVYAVTILSYLYIAGLAEILRKRDSREL